MKGRENMKKLVLTILLTSFIYGCGSDDEEPPLENPTGLGSVSGIITDSNTSDLVSGVEVSIDGTNTTSANDGSYILNDVLIGTKSISGSKSGYTSYTGRTF